VEKNDRIASSLIEVAHFSIEDCHAASWIRIRRVDCLCNHLILSFAFRGFCQVVCIGEGPWGPPQGEALAAWLATLKPPPRASMSPMELSASSLSSRAVR
jgi:hypothetical protein